MSLKTLAPPKRMQTALIEALPSLVQFLQQHPQVGVHHRHVHKAQIKLWLPVRVGSVTVSPKTKKKHVLARPRLTAKRVAWLCFFKTSQGVNAAIELTVEKSGSIGYQFQQGEIIQRTFSRMKVAARDPRLRRAVYTARLLSIPGLYFSALWFKSGARDLFVSLVRIGSEVKAGGCYSRAEIVGALKDEVSRRKEAHQIILARKRQVTAENGSSQ